MPAASSGAERCRKKFLRFFRKGFHDPKYVDWERGYKWEAHERWKNDLAFAEGLYGFLHGTGGDQTRFERWCELVEGLPRKQTRVLTWPIVTVFGFIAQPDRHIFLKPVVTKTAAAEYGYDFIYKSRPNWATYASLLGFAERVRKDTRDLRPRDMIDLQSFIWVQGSDEYEE
jgi:hypothetical protein